MATPVSIVKVTYTGLGLTIGDTILVNYSLAFDIPDFSTLTVTEESDPATSLTYVVESLGTIRITQNGTTPAAGTFVLTLDVPTDSFVRSIANGNIFKEQTLQDLFTQIMIISGSVSEGRLAAFEQDIDMNNNQIKNMADGTDPQDAVTRSYGDANYGGTAATDAAASAAAALVSEVAAQSSEDDAAISETNAATSETNAAISEANALSYVGAVQVSADDTTPSHLEDKLLAGTALTATTQNGGANETRTIDLDDTAVAPAAYTYGNFTVDAQGRLTAASSGANGTTGGAGILELLADAEFAAGADTARAVTVSNIKNNIGFVKLYESAEQTITTAALLTLAHGLTVAPKFIFGRFICKTAEIGYSVGDVLYAPLITQAISTSAALGCAAVADGTNVYIRFGSDAQVFAAKDFTTGGGNWLTNANWKLIVMAWG